MKVGIISSNTHFELLRDLSSDIKIKRIIKNDFNSQLAQFDLLIIILSKNYKENDSLIRRLKLIDYKEILIVGELSIGSINELRETQNRNIINCYSDILYNQKIISSSKIIIGDDIRQYPLISKFLASVFPNCSILETDISTVECIPFMISYFKFAKANLYIDIRETSNKLNLKTNSIIDIISQEQVSLTLNRNDLENTKYLFQSKSKNNIQTHLIQGILRSYTFNLRNDYIPLKNNNKVIHFYEIEQSYGFLSNLSDHPIYLDNTIWRTVEHYYQAKKFSGTQLEEEIRCTFLPTEAKRIADINKVSYVKNWHDQKKEIMERALRAKFNQHKDLKKKILSTKNKKLVEHTENDHYWGDGGDGSGKNTLGILLMKIRSELK
ncbi:NADAR family protein [Prolixibacteraceae bacterium]|nr:NADAR family protein [Prolixibacteraceae bacterium]